MDTTAVKQAAGLDKSDADRLRKDLDQLRNDVALLSEHVSASASRRVRSNVSAARSGLDGAQQRTLELGRDVGGEIKARPLTVAAAASAIGLLALAACLMR